MSLIASLKPGKVANLHKRPFSVLPSEAPRDDSPNIPFKDNVEFVDTGQIVLPNGQVAHLCPLQDKSPVFFNHNKPMSFVKLYYHVASFGTFNYLGARKTLPHITFKIPVWRSYLKGTEHYELCDFLQYGFPLGLDYSKELKSTLKNHPSAVQYSSHVDKFIQTELDLNGIAGNFDTCPFWNPVISPLMTAHKKPDSRRICFDLTFGDFSINNATPEGEYMGVSYTYNYPKIDEFESLIAKHGPGALMWKCDLSRFFMQLPIDPIDYPSLCFIWRNLLYFYISMPFGHRNSGMGGQKVTTAVRDIFKKKGILFDGNPFDALNSVSYTHLTLPTKRIV